MLEDVNSGGFGDDLGERLGHRNDGLDDRDEVIEDGLEFGKIVGSGREQNVISVDGAGFLEVRGLEIERSERRATMEITEQHGVENGGEHLVPFSSCVGGGGSVGVDAEDISAGNERFVGNVVGDKFEQCAREEILLDVGWLGVTGHGSNTVMERREEINRNETTKEVLEMESSSGGNEEDVLGAIGFSCSELSEDGFHRIRDGEREQVFSESIFPGDCGPGCGVGGWRWADVEIVEEEEALETDGVVEDESGEGRLGLILVVSGGGGGGSKLHDEHEDGDLGREDVDSPIIGGSGFRRRVLFKQSEGVGDVVRILDIFDFENNGLVLEVGELVGECRHS
jgi:hypothetical protein